MALTPLNYTIATLGSHTALQILKGAKDEGFRTLAIVTPQTKRVFESYPVADELIEISRFEDYFTIEEKLIEKNAIIIPHGSFVSYVGPKQIELNMKALYYGSKGILEW